MDEEMFNVFLKTGTRFVSDMARLEFGKESFYLIVPEKPVRGKKCCEGFNHQEA